MFPLNCEPTFGDTCSSGEDVLWPRPWFKIIKAFVSLQP